MYIYISYFSILFYLTFLFVTISKNIPLYEYLKNSPVSNYESITSSQEGKLKLD